ncbi:hypothetical protein K443DRAFT_11242 [Laccaria amethystina LaAM-08-1]|uniref:Uncharacterized protein n=1 Tax=Laccaria amethystina LaAM-08-1 TaxID=1095629 RepID=A0A0C9XHN1_9AGAR|nr:hypothetical protein K443DRAFT_11242 [Laccaria amethystina LaAM-08-1]
MTGLLDATNVPRSTSIQRKSLPTCTLSLASVSAHTGKFRMAVDLPHHAYVQANVVPFPSVAAGGGGSAHALLRSSQPPPVRPRPRISTSVTSSIRRKRSASRITSPSSASTPPTPKPPRKRARTTTASKSILKPTTAPASTPAPRRAPPADIKLNACVYHTIFSLGLKRHAAAAGKRRASSMPRCTSPNTPGAASPRPKSPRFDDSDDSDLDSEIEEELETAVHHAILAEQDIMLSLRLRCFLLKNGVDPRVVFFQQQEREEEIEREEMGTPDPFLKDPNLGEEVNDVNEDEKVKDMDSMDVEVESGTPSVPSSCTPVALRNAPPPPFTSLHPEAKVHFPSDLPSQTRSQPTRTMSTSPPRPSSSSPRPASTSPPGPSSPPCPTPKLKPAPPKLPPPSYLTAILLLRHAAKERQRYRSILARVEAGTGTGVAQGEKSPLRRVFSRAEEEEGGWEQEGGGDVVMVMDEDSGGSNGSVLEDVLMAMMVEDPESESRREGMEVDLDA